MDRSPIICRRMSVVLLNYISKFTMARTMEDPPEAVPSEHRSLFYSTQLKAVELTETLRSQGSRLCDNEIKAFTYETLNLFCMTQRIYQSLDANYLFQMGRNLCLSYNSIVVLLLEKIQKLNQKVVLLQKRESTVEGMPQSECALEQPEEHTGRVPFTQLKIDRLGGVHLYNENHARGLEDQRILEQLKVEKELRIRKKRQQLMETIIFQQLNHSAEVQQPETADELTKYIIETKKKGSIYNYTPYEGELQDILAFFNNAQNQANDFLVKKARADPKSSQATFSFADYQREVQIKNSQVKKKILARLQEYLSSFRVKQQEMEGFRSEKESLLQQLSSLKNKKGVDGCVQTEYDLNLFMRVSQNERKELELTHLALQHLKQSEGQSLCRENQLKYEISGKIKDLQRLEQQKRELQVAVSSLKKTIIVQKSKKSLPLRDDQEPSLKDIKPGKSDHLLRIEDDPDISNHSRRRGREDSNEEISMLNSTKRMARTFANNEWRKNEKEGSLSSSKEEEAERDRETMYRTHQEKKKVVRYQIDPQYRTESKLKEKSALIVSQETEEQEIPIATAQADLSLQAQKDYVPFQGEQSRIKPQKGRVAESQQFTSLSKIESVKALKGKHQPSKAKGSSHRPKIAKAGTSQKPIGKARPDKGRGRQTSKDGSKEGRQGSKEGRQGRQASKESSKESSKEGRQVIKEGRQKEELTGFGSKNQKEVGRGGQRNEGQAAPAAKQTQQKQGERDISSYDPTLKMLAVVQEEGQSEREHFRALKEQNSQSSDNIISDSSSSLLQAELVQRIDVDLTQRKQSRNQLHLQLYHVSVEPSPSPSLSNSLLSSRRPSSEPEQRYQQGALPKHCSVFRDKTNDSQSLPKDTVLESHRKEERREPPLVFAFDDRHSNNQNGNNKNQSRFSKEKPVPASMVNSPTREEELPLEVCNSQSGSKGSNSKVKVRESFNVAAVSQPTQSVVQELVNSLPEGEGGSESSQNKAIKALKQKLLQSYKSSKLSLQEIKNILKVISLTSRKQTEESEESAIFLAPVMSSNRLSLPSINAKEASQNLNLQKKRQHGRYSSYCDLPNFQAQEESARPRIEDLIHLSVLEGSFESRFKEVHRGCKEGMVCSHVLKYIETVMKQIETQRNRQKQSLTLHVENIGGIVLDEEGQPERKIANADLLMGSRQTGRIKTETGYLRRSLQKVKVGKMQGLPAIREQK